jgi:hypothetical protein
LCCKIAALRLREHQNYILGFACFASEIIDDLKSHSEEEVYQLVTKRLEGLRFYEEALDEDF